MVIVKLISPLILIIILMIATNQIIHADCIDVMKDIPDKYFDLTLTDFPYGINENYNTFIDTKENVKELINKTMPEILRVSKRVLLTCATRQITWYPESDWILNWYCKAGTGMNPWGFTTWQPILAYGKDPYLENCMGSRPDTIEHIETSEKNNHPCPKPLRFWKKLLLRGSVKETDIIFDPFAGSGTTAMACIDLNRKYVCVELDKDYYNDSLKRINKELLKIKMFD